MYNQKLLYDSTVNSFELNVIMLCKMNVIMLCKNEHCLCFFSKYIIFNFFSVMLFVQLGSGYFCESTGTVFLSTRGYVVATFCRFSVMICITVRGQQLLGALVVDLSTRGL